MKLRWANTASISSRGLNRGLLLPQVATQYHWDRQTFLEQTCNKAGLPPDAWKDPSTQIYLFRAEIFADHPPNNRLQVYRGARISMTHNDTPEPGHFPPPGRRRPRLKGPAAPDLAPPLPWSSLVVVLFFGSCLPGEPGGDGRPRRSRRTSVAAAPHGEPAPEGPKELELNPSCRAPRAPMRPAPGHAGPKRPMSRTPAARRPPVPAPGW